jgi:hypothetical protein
MGQCFPSGRLKQPVSSGNDAARSQSAARAAAAEDAGVRGGGGGDEPRSQSEHAGRAANTDAGKGRSQMQKADPYFDEEGWGRGGADEAPEMADVGPNMVVVLASPPSPRLSLPTFPPHHARMCIQIHTHIHIYIYISIYIEQCPNISATLIGTTPFFTFPVLLAMSGHGRVNATKGRHWARKVQRLGTFG